MDPAQPDRCLPHQPRQRAAATGLFDSFLNELAVQDKPAFRWTCRYHMKGSSSLEVLEFASTAHKLPHAVVQALGFAVRPRDIQYLHSPFDVRLVTVCLCELEIAARLAGHAGYYVVSAILLDRRACERTLAICLAFPPHQREEVLTAVDEIKPSCFFRHDQCIEFDWFRPCISCCADPYGCNK